MAGEAGHTSAERTARLSFVIPARDEEDLIGTTLEAIRSAIGGRWDYEMIVIDNGSGDDTATVAENAGAIVVAHPEGTIGALRNAGVTRSRGDCLVFLDADVLLTSAWAAQFPAALERLHADPRVLTGRMCTIPEDPSWIERNWFGSRRPGTRTHIGSGHLITTRRFFDEVGGFDESLRTGEDYDFSRRAIAQGGQIVPDPELVAVHRRFPRTLRQFFLREVWHGSDVDSLAGFFRSKVAVASLLFGLAHAALLVSVLARSSPGVVIALSVVLFITAGSAAVKYRGRSPRVLATNAFLFYCYYAARLFSIFGGVAYPGRSRAKNEQRS